MQEIVPAAWRPAYRNNARSGFGTDKVLNGGKDDCDALGPNLAATEAELSARKDSWNRVLITAGINDTNWKLLLISMLRLPEYFPEVACRLWIRTFWNGPAMSRQIQTNAGMIASRLRLADPAVRIAWVGYYNIAGTGRIEGLELRPLLPQAWERPIGEAMAFLHDTIASGLAGTDVPLVRTNVLDLRDDLLQPLLFVSLPPEPLGFLGGWPHPNSSGAATIASLFASDP
jgi:hypothetical protein